MRLPKFPHEKKSECEVSLHTRRKNLQRFSLSERSPRPSRLPLQKLDSSQHAAEQGAGRINQAGPHQQQRAGFRGAGKRSRGGIVCHHADSTPVLLAAIRNEREVPFASNVLQGPGMWGMMLRRKQINGQTELTCLQPLSNAPFRLYANTFQAEGSSLPINKEDRQKSGGPGISDVIAGPLPAACPLRQNRN
jgi:hypothetical protein